MLIALINLLKGDNIKVSHNNLWRESRYGKSFNSEGFQAFAVATGVVASMVTIITPLL